MEPNEACFHRIDVEGMMAGLSKVSPSWKLFGFYSQLNV